MKNRSFKQIKLALLIGACVGFAVLGSGAASAQNAPGGQTLVITDKPLPEGLRSKIYSQPSRAPVINPEQVVGNSYFQQQETVVGMKVESLRNELFELQGRIADVSQRLADLQNDTQAKAAEYYASVATIRTQLQSGTTPGNPRLIERLGVAQDTLERLDDTVVFLNNLSIEISNLASISAYLLEACRAAYGLSGAVEEDHAKLAQMEDAVNNTIVVVERLQNNVNDDISRAVAYLSSERSNMRTLALAVTKGDFFGKSLSNRPFSSAPMSAIPEPGGMMAAAAPGTMPPGMVSAMPLNASMGFAGMTPQPAAMSSARPLVKIKFDNPDVKYEQPVYMAVSNALERFPNAQFEMVAVHPTGGNAAQMAIESTRARRNAEKVLRSLTQMGLQTDRIDLSYKPSPNVQSSEVHIYMR